MHYVQVGKSFRVARITGPTHNLLGIEFAETSKTPQVVVEALRSVGDQPATLFAEAVQQNALQGVEEGNKEFGTNYVVKRIEFVSNDSEPADVYRLLAKGIVERLAKGLPFAEGV